MFIPVGFFDCVSLLRLNQPSCLHYILSFPAISYFPLSASICLQLLSEKISGAEGTKLDEDFTEMERVSSLNACISSPASVTWVTSPTHLHIDLILGCPLLSERLRKVCQWHKNRWRCDSFMIFFSPYLCLIVLVFLLVFFFFLENWRHEQVRFWAIVQNHRIPPTEPRYDADPLWNQVPIFQLFVDRFRYWNIKNENVPDMPMYRNQSTLPVKPDAL